MFQSNLSYYAVESGYNLIAIISLITNLLFLAGLVMSTVLIFKNRKKLALIITAVSIFITFVCNPFIKTVGLYIKFGNCHFAEGGGNFTYWYYFLSRLEVSFTSYLFPFVFWGLVMYCAVRYSKKLYNGGNR